MMSRWIRSNRQKDKKNKNDKRGKKEFINIPRKA